MDMDVDMDMDMDINDDDEAKDKKQSKEKEQTNKTEGKNTSSKKLPSKRHYKYMTNSQLLHLQLQDPEIRMHILTQLFIISAYLRQSIFSNKKLNQMTVERVCESLLKLEEKAGELLKLTPPNGQMQLTTLQWILKERESVWSDWKKAKCIPQIEKIYTSDATNNGGEKSDQPQTKRKKLMDGPLASGRGNKNSTETSLLASMSDLYAYKVGVKSKLRSISVSIAKEYTPNRDNYFEDYVEALDPEAEIEEYYHPKNNKLFTWRAMRLLNESYIGKLGRDETGCKLIDLENGDFEGLVRKIWKEEKGIEIPGDKPMADDTVEENSEVIAKKDESELLRDKVEQLSTVESNVDTKQEKTETNKETKVIKICKCINNSQQIFI